MFPLAAVNEWTTGTIYFVSLLIGVGFGFALERTGFGNALVLAMQFYFRDKTVLKTFFTAIITAMSGVIILNSVGLLDTGAIFINPTYMWPGLVGAAIMGIGFPIGAY